MELKFKMTLTRSEKMKKLKSCFPADIYYNGIFQYNYKTFRDLKKCDPMLAEFIIDDLFIPCNDPENEKLLNFCNLNAGIKKFDEGGLNRFIPKNELDLWYMTKGLKLVRTLQNE